jgi:DNA-binding CsgD family transcriptional regulator
LLNISGASGIGKSALMRAFYRAATELGVPARLVDARVFPTGPDALLNVLGGSREPGLCAQFNETRRLILLDHFEEMAGLAWHLWQKFLPRLKTSVKVVIAGRQPLSRTWASESDWHRLIRCLPLGGLSLADSRLFLRRSGVTDPSLQEHILHSTGGYPLLLSMSATQVLHVGARGQPTPELHLIIRSIVERVLSEVDEPELRLLLAACAVVHRCDEATLAAISGRADAAAVFERMCHLSVMRPTERGLILAPEVRRLLADDLRWRCPEVYRALRDWVQQRGRRRRWRTPPLGRAALSVVEKPDPRFRLTHREREVLGVLVCGHTTSREIAAELVISDGTANLHVKRILRKLGFGTRAELAAWASQQPPRERPPTYD